MTKLALVALLTACGAAPRTTTTPAQRADAIQLYMGGASADEVAAHFAMAPGQGRELIHEAVLEINRRYYGNR